MRFRVESPNFPFCHISRDFEWGAENEIPPHTKGHFPNPSRRSYHHTMTPPATTCAHCDALAARLGEAEQQLSDARVGLVILAHVSEAQNDFDRLCRDVADWGERTFQQSTRDSVLAHLRREVQELVGEADPLLRRIECADVFMLMAHLARKEGWSLREAIEQKFQENQHRRWGEPDEEGVVEHIRD